jgi:mono/diheme cytochrome c family protein
LLTTGALDAKGPNMMHRILVGLVFILAIAAVPLTASIQPASAKTPAKADKASIDRGRYLVKIAGCNDCHTAGYAMAGGKVPESQWLMGDNLGWRGPWGTTYPPNLRIYMRGMTEANWVRTAKSLKTRPPMPWFVLHDMTEQDLTAIYRYVSTLGPAGDPAPAYLPPGKEPPHPYVQFPAPPQ